MKAAASTVDRPTTINIIDVFDGPRVRQLRSIWRALALWWRPAVEIFFFDNRTEPIKNHATCYTEMWAAERRRDETRTIFTEMDFLPGPSFFLPLRACTFEAPVVAAQYVTRDLHNRLAPTDMPGAWYVAINKSLVDGRTLEFHPRPGRPDPCNSLDSTVGVQLLKQEDCLPEHFGTSMLPGVHLFGTTRQYGNGW
jgi:hypothetical protein